MSVEETGSTLSTEQPSVQETKKDKRKTVKKVFSIIANVLVYAFFIICAVSLIISVANGKDNRDGVELFGHKVMRVLTNSMEACEQTDVSTYKIKDLPVNSAIFVELVPEDPAEADAWYAELSRGDVLTFRYYYTQQVTITHRITDIYKNKSGVGYTIHLEGDNKASDANTLTQIINTAEAETSYNYVIGKVTGSSKLLGTMVSFIDSPVGIVCIIIIPSVIIAIMSIITIVATILSAKEKKRRDAEEAKQSEMDAMRQELEALRRRAAENEGAAQETQNNHTESNTSTEE